MVVDNVLSIPLSNCCALSNSEKYRYRMECNTRIRDPNYTTLSTLNKNFDTSTKKHWIKFNLTC